MAEIFDLVCFFKSGGSTKSAQLTEHFTARFSKRAADQAFLQRRPIPTIAGSVSTIKAQVFIACIIKPNRKTEPETARIVQKSPKTAPSPFDSSFIDSHVIKNRLLKKEDPCD